MSSTVLSVVDTQSISLTFFVDEEDWQGKFSHLEVWRSLLGDGGPFELLTGAGWSPAVLPEGAWSYEPGSGIVGGSVNIVGKSIEFLVNESVLLSHVFTGTDPLTRAACATQVSAAMGVYLFAYVDASSQFVVRTQQSGALASVRATATDAAAILGLPTTDPENLAFGTESRLLLQPGVSRYAFRDPYGKDIYFYRSRLYNASTHEVSAFSSAVTGRPSTVVDPAVLAIGYCRMVGLDGRAVRGREILVYNAYTSTRVEGGLVVNEGQRLFTDDNGYIELPLLRGASVDVVLPGTALSQRITVPTDQAVSKFDLFDPAYGNNDALGVQRLEGVYADRRSL